MVHGALLVQCNQVVRIEPVFINTDITADPELIIDNPVFTVIPVAQQGAFGRCLLAVLPDFIQCFKHRIDRDRTDLGHAPVTHENGTALDKGLDHVEAYIVAATGNEYAIQVQAAEIPGLHQ